VRQKAFRLGTTVLVLCILAAYPLSAQVAGVIRGTVKDSSGNPVVGAAVAMKNASSGQSTKTTTTATGTYELPNLSPGDYEISVSSDGFSPRISQLTLQAGAIRTFDIVLSAKSLQQGSQEKNLPEAPASNLPNAPPTNSTEPSLSDLGFSQSQLQGNAAEQARLDKRSHMLKIHQRMGLITAVPLIATVFSGGFAGGKDTSSSSRDLHAALGSVTAGLYFTTASFAIFAPKIPGTRTRGPIRVHKALAWIHGPGMILTPILGAMAYDQKSRGEKVHGIAAAHGAVAIITAGAFGAALLSVSVKF
jgi:Carboxypeptidase regulatory-like domain